jgi:uncharacterized protein YbaA (DUF1428 family)
MAHYVDGFVIPLPKKRLNAYRRLAQKAGEDPRLAKIMDPKVMPFDVKRIMYGGFKTIIEA